jgi:DNA repair protein RecO (recombination protein O)
VALLTTEGVALRSYALGDTSRIVVVYTREMGMLRLVAKGARKSPNRFGFALEPLTRSRFVVYHKPDRDLHLVSQAEVVNAIGSRITDLTRLTHAHAAIELVDRLVWGEEPHPELYALLVDTLDAAMLAPAASLSAVTLAFELQTAGLLGYRPRMDACAECGRAPSSRRLFSPARGGLLCDACAAGEPGVVTLSADALAGLTLLLTRPVLEAGRYLELKRAGEILKAVEAFLRHHFQRFQGLQSLEMLRSLVPHPTPESA